MLVSHSADIFAFSMNEKMKLPVVGGRDDPASYYYSAEITSVKKQVISILNLNLVSVVKIKFHFLIWQLFECE